jgi:hypothetical protein
MLLLGGLPMIMDPDRGFAVTPSTTLGSTFVTNANLYFFSWFSFFCIFYISGSFLSACHKEAKEAIMSISATQKLGT